MIVENIITGKAYDNRVFLVSEPSLIEQISLTSQELTYFQKKRDEEIKLVPINRYDGWIFIASVDRSLKETSQLEEWRRRGNEVAAIAKKEKIAELELFSFPGENSVLSAFAEGLILGSYQFSKYLSKAEEKSTSLKRVIFSGDCVSDKQISVLSATMEAVTLVRDMVNEPVVYLNAEKLSEVFVEMGKEAGFDAEVLKKQQIESLKMGGLLAVNKGSIDPPTFSILEWKPENAVNKQPIVLVGKGVVFDTGGLSLKPTANSMDYMKCDMAGGATVAGVLYYAAKTELPIHLIALIPATDNRPDGNAVAPGDVIRMLNGATVEVLNTDAEGRLLLADALSFAKKYDPVLVIDVATLTGSAAMALGIHGIAAMGNADKEVLDSLKKSGENVYERIVEFPLWEEYGEMIKSDIADMKNIGSREAGVITAGKFLQRFTDYPWIHLDIAGPAYLQSPDHYRGKGGSATGVRLLCDFLKNYADELSSLTI
jgi:leucyl aminopeptidase